MSAIDPLSGGRGRAGPGDSQGLRRAVSCAPTAGILTERGAVTDRGCHVVLPDRAHPPLPDAPAVAAAVADWRDEP
jgi:hypothetical protein